MLRDEPGSRDVMRMHAFECRVAPGSLPGLSVGDLVEVDIADDEYTFSKPDGVRVASVPIASTEEEKDLSGWVTLRNPAAGITVTLSPTDKLAAAWASVIEGAAHRGGSSKT